MTEQDEAGYFKQLNLFTAIIKTSGVPGLLVVGWLLAFFFVFSDAQQTAFIDKFILLETTQENPWPCVIVILFLLITIVACILFYSQSLKVSKREAQRIGREKSELHEKMIKLELPTSD